MIEEAARKVAEWRRDPVKFVREQFGVEPDGWQGKVMRAFGEEGRRRISMQACAGPGKSAVLAWCGWNFLACYGEGGEHPKGVAVSITQDNLRDNLWSEMAKWQGRSRFLSEAFVWTKQRVFARQHGATWFIAARSFSKTADEKEQGATLSGLHSKYLLYLVDESGAISPTILRSAEQGIGSVGGGGFGKIVQAGNPLTNEGMLWFAAHEQKRKWYIVKITGDPEDRRRSSRVDIEWARDQIEQYGRDNPWVMAYILGKFPPTAINALLSAEEVGECMGRVVRQEWFLGSEKRLGVDVARFGDDATVIFPRQGRVGFEAVVMRNARTEEIAAKVARMKGEWGSQVEMIDTTGGYGAGVEDALAQAGYQVVPVNFSSRAYDPRYFNLRSQIWFEMAQWVKKRGSLPKDSELSKELTTPTYYFQNGKLRLEEKAQIKKRLGKSPDKADALAVTFAMPEVGGPVGGSQEQAMALLTRRPGSAKYEYDPLRSEDGGTRGS